MQKPPKNPYGNFGRSKGVPLAENHKKKLIFWSETISNKRRIAYNDHPEQFQTEFWTFEKSKKKILQKAPKHP